jgi:hypothetical protein
VYYIVTRYYNLLRVSSPLYEVKEIKNKDDYLLVVQDILPVVQSRANNLPEFLKHKQALTYHANNVHNVHCFWVSAYSLEQEGKKEAKSEEMELPLDDPFILEINVVY